MNRFAALRLLLPVVLLTELTASAEDLGYAHSLGKAKDEAELTSTERSLEVKIKSSNGIGTLKLSLRKERAKWPESIVLLIRRDDGDPLEELEGFAIEGKMIRVAGSRRTSGQMDAFDLGPGEKAEPGQQKPRKVAVKVTKTKAALRIVIPGSLVAGESALRIQWIDYYRR